MKRLRFRWYMGLLPLIALIAGYATGHGSSAPASAAASVPGSPLTLEYPVNWQETSLPASLLALKLPRSIVLAPRGDASTGGLFAVSVAEEGNLLPEAVMPKLEGRFQGEAVTLVGSPAFRYRKLSVIGSDERLTIYSIPAGGGRYTLAICFAPPQSAQTPSKCEEVVESSQSPAQGAAGLPELEPQPSYARQLSAALKRLEQAQTQARAAMAGASSAPAFVREARRLESAFASAQVTLAALTPPAVAAHAGAELARSMHAAQLAYAALAQAAAAGSSGGFAIARDRVRETEAAVRGALQGLDLLGYRNG
jgi:hypothetical protein